MPLIVTRNMDKPRAEKKTITFRNLKSIDINSFREDLQQCALIILNATCIDDMVREYNSSLAALLDKHAPLISKEVYIRPNSPWFTEELKCAKRQKRRAERRWIFNPSSINLDILKNEKAHYALLCQQAKIAYYDERLTTAGTDQRSMFKIASELLHSRRDLILPTHDDDNRLSDEFATFFIEKIQKISKIFESIDVSCLSTNILNDIDELVNFKTVTEADVKKILVEGNKKCCHLDPLPTSLICLDIFLPIITAIINRSLTENRMPDCLKKATVKPLLKKPSLDREEKSNYRPVSLLPYLSKQIERTVVKQLDSHMKINSLYRSHQSAYRTGHSTETALVKIMDDLLWAMDGQQCALLILLDQSAAFDTVNQDLLLNRLKTSFGVCGNALDWFRSYFKGRKQCVKIEQASSSPRELATGFPQGSVLGPFAYPIYTSPLFDIAAKHGICIHMYADDTQLYVSFRPGEEADTQTRLHGAINEIRQWMADNHLKLNDRKTEYLVIGSSHQQTKLHDDAFTIHIGDCTVDAAGEARNIGVIIDSELTMKQHVNFVCRTCYMHLHNIAKIRACLTQEAAEKMVNALITSRLDYCNALLYGLPDYILDKLQKVQNNAARLIFKKKKHDNITSLLKKLHWLPIDYRIKYKINILTFKARKDQAPDYITSLIKPYVPLRELRSSSKGMIDASKVAKMKTCGDRAFSAAAPKLWNCLPQELRDEQNFSTFKDNLKTHYFKQAFPKDMS